jgi:hypothetical protein
MSVWFVIVEKNPRLTGESEFGIHFLHFSLQTFVTELLFVLISFYWIMLLEFRIKCPYHCLILTNIEMSEFCMLWKAVQRLSCVAFRRTYVADLVGEFLQCFIVSMWTTQEFVITLFAYVSSWENTKVWNTVDSYLWGGRGCFPENRHVYKMHKM